LVASAAKRGVRVMLSNSDTQFIRELYSRERIIVQTVKARRAISCDGAKRGKVDEVVILAGMD
jgi:DNA adenine methylase